MDNSSRTNGPQVCSTEVGENEVDYKQRCRYLESQLEKFREQATKVREVIGQKLKGYEEQVTSAYAKATESAQEVKHLEMLLSVKEETVAQLQEELENEKQKQLIRDKEVEEKAAHIKNWMHKKISEYEEKLKELNEENEDLKRSHKQAMDVVKEIETKLRFSQDQVLRLSHELADIQSQSPDYYELEPETNQGESGFQSYLTGDTVGNQSPVNSLSSECTTPTPMSPDELVKTPTNDDDKDDSSAFMSDQTAEIKIKRTSSGKSPSKIPRFIGTVEDQRAAQISYYMSLKRGMRSPGGSQAKFFIQIQDLHNPYMQLSPLERMSQRKQFDSQSTIDSEIDNSSFETYLPPVEPGVHGEEFHAKLGELVTVQLENGSFTPSISQHKQESFSGSRSSLGSSTEDATSADPIYQTLEPEPDSVRTHTDSAMARKPSVDSGVPLSPPPPPVPPRFELENVAPPPVPPVPRTKKDKHMQDVTRLKGNFTSYLSETDLTNGNAPEGKKVDIAAALWPSNRTDSWMWNDNSAGSDTPPFGTLETRSKNVNMLTVTLNILQEQSCPVYTTLKGRASQIRNTPFSGESTDSSDDESSAGDYCTPPDELGGTEEHHNFKQNTNELLEETKRVLKTCATYTTVSLKKENQRKEGYLTKLGGRVKNWKKRWFVLNDGNLYYYKTENDVNRKPLGQIPLDGSCRIARTDGELTIEVATPKRTFYLTGETIEVVDGWLRVLHNVMRKFSSTPLFAQVKDKEIMKGWLTKVKHGSSKKFWSVLRGQYLCYYKSEDDLVPFSMTHMIDVVVEELESPDSEDRNLNTDAVPYRHFTLVMKSLKQPSTTYLLIDSMEEKDSWLFHLKVASGSGIDDMGTEFEKSIYQLIVEDCDPESEIWNSYVLTHSKEPITEPLTTLPSKELGAEALKLFKSIHLFTTVQTEEAAIDYHVSLAQNALQTCLDNPELQNEIYCQLIKQTSKHVHRGPEDLGHFFEHCGKSSWLREDSFDIASQATIDLRPVQEFVYIQAWQLLSLCTALFVPKQKFLLFLRGHLNRTSTFKTKLGKYATYCIRSLERSLQNGKREARPSRLEVLSILLRKPYDHSCLMSIPVHFFDGSSQVFGFDGSTTIQEFSETINRMVGIRSSSESGYALFTDNPVNLVEHCLQAKVKLCDVISKWEQTLRSQSQGKLDTSRMIKLTYKSRLHFKSLSSGETDKEKYFLVLQTNDSIVKGRFPVSKEMALEFAALMAQISYGDYRAQSNSLPSKRIENVITKFCAKTLREDTGKRALTLRMAEKWSTLHGWSVKECVDKYLENARRWPFFGCKLFQAQQKHTVSATKRRTAPVANTQPVWLAVEEDSINLLEGNSLRLMCRYRYKHVVTFGGWKEDFMLVVNQSIMRGGNTVEQGTQRLLFVMPRAKILEITLLMASYINAIVRQKGITCDAPDTGTATGQAVDVKVWDLESAEWPMVPGSTVGLL